MNKILRRSTGIIVAGIVVLLLSMGILWIVSTDYGTVTPERMMGTVIPGYATDARGFTFSFLQGSRAYVRLDVPVENWQDFIDSICYAEVNDGLQYSVYTDTTTPDSNMHFTEVPFFLPRWWQAENVDNYETGVCGAKASNAEVQFLTDMGTSVGTNASDEALYTLYLTVTPP